MFEVEYELKQRLLEIEGFEAIGDFDKRERAVLSAVSIAGALGFPCGVRPIGYTNGTVEDTQKYPIPNWAGEVVAYIGLPTGEISYFLKKDTSAWSGYTRDVKLARIHDYINNKHIEPEENEC